MYLIYRIADWRTLELPQLLEESRGVRAIFFGEVHQIGWILLVELDLLRAASSMLGLGFLGLEMFNYRQQRMLDSWEAGRISWKELVEAYSRSREGFDLNHYEPLLRLARGLGVKLIGVMPPRELAAEVARRGPEAVDSFPDSPVTSRDIGTGPKEYRGTLERLFPRTGPMAKLSLEGLLAAQAFKDSVIAAIVRKAVRSYGRGIVVTGWAHSEIPGSAPARLGRPDHLVITSRNATIREVAMERRELKKGLATYIALRSRW